MTLTDSTFPLATQLDIPANRASVVTRFVDFVFYGQNLVDRFIHICRELLICLLVRHIHFAVFVPCHTRLTTQAVDDPSAVLHEVIFICWNWFAVGFGTVMRAGHSSNECPPAHRLRNSRGGFDGLVSCTWYVGRK